MRPSPCLFLVAALVAACHHKPPPTSTQSPEAAVDSKAPAHVEAGAKASVDAAAGPADDALPVFASDELTTRGRHLFEAIQKDDATLALDIVFPRDAYLGIKDVADPGRNWDMKVLAAFKNQVHRVHKRTRGIDRAVFSTFELGQPATELLPKRHDLKRMLWRVKRSRVNFTIDGKPMHLDVAEMLGWRGAWYVTRLR